MVDGNRGKSVVNVHLTHESAGVYIWGAPENSRPKQESYLMMFDANHWRELEVHG